jgi:holo-[acyl-carrier protein] synthase
MIGVDLVFIPEFQNQLEVGGDTFIERSFRLSEMKNHKAEHLAGLWAAKEAVIKAAETAPEKYTDIVITHDKSGKPHAYVGSQEFAISIAHHGDYAIAVACRADR